MEGSNPWAKASHFAKVYCTWVFHFIRLGNKRNLGPNDLYPCSKEYGAELLGDRLEEEWNKELKKSEHKGKASIIKAILRTFKKDLLIVASLTLFQHCVLRVIQPLLLRNIVRFFVVGKEEEKETIILYLFFIWFTSVVFCMTGTVGFTMGSQLGLKVRVACSTLMYRKTMKLSSAAVSSTAIGQIINLMSNNFNRFDLAGKFFSCVLPAPLLLIIIAVNLWLDLGVSGLPGCFLFIIQLAFQTFMGKIISRQRTNTAKNTDERVRILNESFSAMRLIKMYTWERPILKDVEKARRKETAYQLIRSTLIGMVSDMAHLFGKIATFFTILTYYLLHGRPLSSQDLFLAVSFFENLRFSLRLFTFGVNNCSECISALQRFEKFLLIEERKTLSYIRDVSLGDNMPAISVSNLTAKWNKDALLPTFHDISLTLKKGEILAIVGPVGSGKTSFLLSLIGELPYKSGSMEINGKLAYVPQEAWLFNGTIKDNVLVFSDMNQTQYAEMLMNCTLNKDLADMENGDKTHVGEKGDMLSGGQKARINLARALCSDADIFLLDDPLSAVDAAVGKKLFHNCINGYLKSKTRILVTHQIQFLKNVDKILILNEGHMVALGTYKELKDRGVDFKSLVKEEPTSEDRPVPSVPSDLRRLSEISVPPIQETTNTQNMMEDLLLKLDDKVTNSMDSSTNCEMPRAHTTRTCLSYGRAGGGFFVVLFYAIIAISAQFLYNLIDVFLSAWSSMSACPYTNSTDVSLADVFFKPGSGHEGCINFLRTSDSYFYLYVTGIACLLVFWNSRSFTFFHICNRAARYIHQKVIRSLFYAPISFFEANPIGKILNRVTKDMGNVDEVLPSLLCECFTVILLQCGYAGLNIYYLPYMAIPTVALLVFAISWGKYYLRPGMALQRLESACASPVYSHLGESVYGLAIIRTFRGESKFTDKFCHLQNIQTSASATNLGGSACFRACVDAFNILYLACVKIFIYFSPDADENTAGLTLSGCLQMALSFQYACLMTLNCISLMVSMERLIEYKKLPVEEVTGSDENGEDQQVERGWPLEAKVEFKDVSLYYDKNLPPSLDKLCFTVEPGESVGIVGRTGAGKSSIISALLRLREPEGLILIDGVPTRNISLRDLRRNISVIPQDPVLFSGPLRKSLDPFGRFPDFKIWKALQQVHMDCTVAQLSGGLDTVLSEGGSNFSVGQRQLLCLARAILLQNRLLVLDEATANIDPRTDSIIQRSIRENFDNCTSLTVAHRLDTIIDSDRVMVLDRGRVQEFEEPFVLLQNENSYFSRLLKETGVSNTNYLTNRAREVYDSRSLNRQDGSTRRRTVSAAEENKTQDYDFQERDELDP